jgi:hypothetical protein
MSMPIYRATARRDGKWWVVSVDGLPAGGTAVTQGRDLDDARHMAQDLVMCLLDVPASEVAIEFHVPATVPVFDPLHPLARTIERRWWRLRDLAWRRVDDCLDGILMVRRWIKTRWM